jgi:hypothetical protein
MNHGGAEAQSGNPQPKWNARRITQIKTGYNHGKH